MERHEQRIQLLQLLYQTNRRPLCPLGRSPSAAGTAATGLLVSYPSLGWRLLLPAKSEFTPDISTRVADLYLWLIGQWAGTSDPARKVAVKESGG